MAVLGRPASIAYKRGTLEFHTYDFLEIITMVVAYITPIASAPVTPFPIAPLSLVAFTSVLADVWGVEQITFLMIPVKLDFP